MLNLALELKKIRNSTGLSQQKFADLVGIPQRTWSNYESGQSTPKMGVLWGLAAKGYTIEGLTSNALGKMTEEAHNKFDEDFSLAKSGASPPDMLVESFGQQVEHVSKFTFFKFSNKQAMPVPADEADPNAMVLLPLYSQRAAGGTGQLPTQLEEIEAYLPIFMEILGISNPRNCGCVRVVGDSMTDMSLYNGDLVVFDRTKNEGDGVYVISIDGEMRVKRLEHRTFEKKLVIRSENQKRYPEPEVISYEQAMDSLTIHGKVISWVHRHPY